MFKNQIIWFIFQNLFWNLKSMVYLSKKQVVEQLRKDIEQKQCQQPYIHRLVQAPKPLNNNNQVIIEFSTQNNNCKIVTSVASPIRVPHYQPALSLPFVQVRWILLFEAFVSHIERMNTLFFSVFSSRNQKFQSQITNQPLQFLVKQLQNYSASRVSWKRVISWLPQAS